MKINFNYTPILGGSGERRENQLQFYYEYETKSTSFYCEYETTHSYWEKKSYFF